MLNKPENISIPKYNLKMFDSAKKFIAVFAVGYNSIIRHTHDFIEVIYVISGKGLNCVGDKKIAIGKGDIMVMTPETEAHAIRPLFDEDENEFQIVNLLFDPGEFNYDYSALSSMYIYKTDDDEGMRLLIESFYTEFVHERSRQQQILKGIMSAIMFGLYSKIEDGFLEEHAVKPVQKKRTDDKASYIKAVAKFIRENYYERLTLDDIARGVNLSSGYLQRVFHKERGTTVTLTLLKYRLSRCCKLLIETDLPIQACAEQSGFFDMKNFFRMFKKQIGISPTEYRKAYAERREDG